MTVAVGTLSVALWLDSPPKNALTEPNTSNAQGSGAGTASRAALESRPVYRHSVVPGGVRTPAELARAMARDYVVATHYAKVNPRALRVEELRKPMLAHVSYRMGSRVYWTKKKLTLHAGEKVLTDGTTTIRVRCGNNVSLEPLAPVASDEPAPEEFDALGEPILMAALPGEEDPSAEETLTASTGPGAAPGNSTSPGVDPSSPTTPPRSSALVLPTPFVGSGNPPTNPNPPVDPPTVPPGQPPVPPTTEPPPGPPTGPPTGPPPTNPPPTAPPPTGPPPTGPPNPPPTVPPPTEPPPTVPPTIPPPSNPPGGPPDPPIGPPGPPVDPEDPVDPPDEFVPVPEPATLVLVGVGAAAGLARHLRKRRSREP